MLGLDGGLFVHVLQASISECSSAKTLSYRWALIGPSALFSSTSLDPRAFRLPANSLSAGTTYNVTVTVTDNLGQASNASTQVHQPTAPQRGSTQDCRGH